MKEATAMARARAAGNEKRVPDMTEYCEEREEYSFPLFVDLDGTLIKSDLLIESFFALLKRNPLYLFAIPFWLLRGKAWLKQQIAERVDIDTSLLPYNIPFLEYLRTQASLGRKLVLATASNQLLAHKVADYLGIFGKVLASDENKNLSGRTKLSSMLEECGEHGFDYAGNATVDLQIWPHSRNAILVNPDRGVEKASRKVSRVQEIFVDRQFGIKPYLKALRIHQWLKNLLLFVPLVAAHQWQNLALVQDALLGFLAFSLCASSVYLLNDLLDLPSDRSHPHKRKRPFASGDISILYGSLLLLLLPLLGFQIALLLPPAFLQVLVGYLALTLAYSFVLKSYVLIDVLLLAALYTIRVIAGAAVIGVETSFWLLAFSMFVFLSLALVKRCSELITLARDNSDAARGRDYQVSDLGYLQSMGIACGYLSVLVIALFINDPEVSANYSHPRLLWMLCPALLYWVSRMWLKTGRGEMHDDPLVFSVKDRGSRYVAVAIAVVVALAV